MAEAALISLTNPVFRMFLGYATVVILKTMIMSGLTAIQRFKNRAFANEEDIARMNKGKEKKVHVQTNNEHVERVRRCHLNDLENVIPFVLLGLLYVTTGPALETAALHFRIFTGCRVFHTVAYLLPLPQPSRALGFFGGLLVCLSMAYTIILKATF